MMMMMIVIIVIIVGLLCCIDSDVAVKPWKLTQTSMYQWSLEDYNAVLVFLRNNRGQIHIFIITKYKYMHIYKYTFAYVCVCIYIYIVCVCICAWLDIVLIMWWNHSCNDYVLESHYIAIIYSKNKMITIGFFCESMRTSSVFFLVDPGSPFLGGD